MTLIENHNPDTDAGDVTLSVQDDSVLCELIFINRPLVNYIARLNHAIPIKNHTHLSFWDDTVTIFGASLEDVVEAYEKVTEYYVKDY